MDGDEDDRLAYAFAAFDTDGNHKIDREELSTMLQKVNGWDVTLANAQANIIMSTFDTKGASNGMTGAEQGDDELSPALRLGVQADDVKFALRDDREMARLF